MNNILLVGVGPHAKKVYAPWLSSNPDVATLVAAVELEELKAVTSSYFYSLKQNPELVFTPQFTSTRLPKELDRHLQDIVKRKSVNSIIIATEPELHKPYALWAMKNGLNVIMDKPISAVQMASLKPKAAKQLMKDYYEILDAYKHALAKKPDLAFIVNTQRRFHQGFDEIFKLIKNVSDDTGCPVTSIQTSHADGQWRLPDEVIDIGYHGYSKGYGKASHSGYHSFDLIAQIIRHGVPREKRPNFLEIAATSTRPSDYFAQISHDDYRRLFKKDVIEFKRDEEELLKITKNFGEIDQFSMLNFKRKNAIICTAQISLLHNSFSERSWLKPNDDLYKGNGRVKHEHHFIQQGPLQSIQVQSYQHFSNDDDNHTIYETGGARHFDIHIFRNNKIIGGKRYEKISLSNLLSEEQADDLTLDELNSKSLVLKNFFDYLNGEVSREKLRSQISDHENSVIIMAGVYLAQIQHLNSRLSLTKLPLSA